ncbi:hypothetical protein, partial [Rosenbergiella nectarea]|uniref:hypothetical protein n=1 Tax=Rosenbergiella nectarea TaxID=988801 RepID=UPI001F4EE677
IVKNYPYIVNRWRGLVKYQKRLNGQYHPNTYAFYGASEKYPSDDHLIWQQIQIPTLFKGSPVKDPVQR